MRKVIQLLSVCFLVILNACQPKPEAAKSQIVVTTPILASITQELVGNQLTIETLIPNGQDPHDFEPSARQIESLTKADLIIINGSGLEASIPKALEEAHKNGVSIFTATDWVDVINQTEHDHHEGETEAEHEAHEQEGTDHETELHEHDHTGGDPHFWTDPTQMEPVVSALAEQIEKQFGLDLEKQETALLNKLASLDTEMAQILEKLPEPSRKLITGHRSMAYFARRFGFEEIGAIIPSLSSQAEVSAADLATLKTLITQYQINAIFSEIGTPKSVADTISKDAGVKVIPLPTHTLPQDGSYFTFMKNLAGLVADSLR